MTTGIAEYHDGTAWRQCGISVPQFQCYMSLDANNPILTSDAVSQSAVYLHPYGGNIALASNGSVIYPVRFSKQTLTLVSSHLASQIYDCFFWDDGGTLRFVTGPAWNSAVAGSGSRGSGAGTTELTLLGGIYVNAVSMTGRNGNDTWTVPAQEGVYVGSIFMDGTNGEVTCHRSFGQSRKWGLWNAYNRRQIIMKAGDNTSSWPYTSATVRASNGASANSISIFAGLAEEIFDLSFRQNMDTSGSAYAYGRIGIGIDSTTTASGFRGVGQGGTADGELQRSMATASHILAPQLGISVITSLEAMTAGNSLRLYGGEDDMLLTAKWMG